MKNDPNINSIQAFWPKPSAMAAAILLLTAPAFRGFSGTPPALLQITENSDISLTVTFTTSGGTTTSLTPTFNSDDNWTITLPVGVILNDAEADPGVAIQEPGAGSLGPWNNVFQTKGPTPAFSPTVNVVSDSATTDGLYEFIDNGLITRVGSVQGSDFGLNLLFNDLGDGTSTVPDGASTALLALPAILALFGVARLRKSSVPV